MKKLEDDYLHKGMRENLINGLREKGITDELVLKAMMEVPRHYFFDNAFLRIAYEDRAFPIAANQTISQPYTVAFQSQLLQIKQFDKVLEIGTGSMYQATILAEMGAIVHTIERQKELYQATKNFVLKSKYPSARLKFFFWRWIRRPTNIRTIRQNHHYLWRAICAAKIN
jgi:protein-L-isoaspartate(D-aspartate) O-methyltransferase